MPDPWFEDGLRFRCTRCGKCCAGPEPGFVWVTEDEVEMIAEFLGEPLAQVNQLYVRQLGRQRALREKANHDCVFFDHERLHHLQGKARAVPDLAVLGNQRGDAGRLAAYLRSLSRLWSRRPDLGGRDHATVEGHSVVRSFRLRLNAKCSVTSR